jgi:hypothetical protein
MYEVYIGEDSLKICRKRRDALGREIVDGLIGVTQEKKDEILALEVPTNKKAAQCFMGMVNYHARHIPRLAEIAGPISALCGNEPWRWSRPCQITFERIKEAITNAARLTYIREDELAPRGTWAAHLEAPPKKGEPVPKNKHKGQYLFLQFDASLTGLSAILTKGTNWWSATPVYYHSRKFNDLQLRYHTPDQELHAFTEGFDKYEDCLIGRGVTVLCDNGSLAHFLTQKHIVGRPARAYDFLSQFDFQIKHIEGKHNIVPDMLSRQYEHPDSGVGNSPGRFQVDTDLGQVWTELPDHSEDESAVDKYGDLPPLVTDSEEEQDKPLKSKDEKAPLNSAEAPLTASARKQEDLLLHALTSDRPI